MRKIYRFWFMKFWLPAMCWMGGVMAVAFSVVRIFKLSDPDLPMFVGFGLMIVVLLYRGQQNFVGSHYSWLTGLGFGRQKIMGLAAVINFTMLLTFALMGGAAIVLTPVDTPSAKVSENTAPLKKAPVVSERQKARDFGLLRFACYFLLLGFLAVFFSLGYLGKSAEGRPSSMIVDLLNHQDRRVRMRSHLMCHVLPAMIVVGLILINYSDIPLMAEMSAICLALCLAAFTARKAPLQYGLSKLWRLRWVTMTSASFCFVIVASISAFAIMHAAKGVLDSKMAAVSAVDTEQNK